MKQITREKIIQVLVFVGIATFALFLRVYDLNWDGAYMLHPDERFLTMVTDAMRWPVNFGTYLDAHVSTFNPVNIGYQFYVYGALPLVANKLFTLITGYASYPVVGLQGRALSAIVDTLTAVFVFLIVFQFEYKFKFSSKLKYIAMFLYAIAVLPIQLSHFYAVDPFLTFFTTGSYFFALRTQFSQKLGYAFLSGMFLACAIASKVTGIFILPLLLLIVLFPFDKSKWRFYFLAAVVFGLSLYATIRITGPYYFESASWFNLHINATWKESIAQLKTFDGVGVWFPPAIQWMSKTPFFAIKNLAVFGIGLGYFGLLLGGLVLVGANKNYRKYILIVTFVWVLGYFVYQANQFVKALRYFYFLYPFYAIAASFAFYEIARRSKVLGVFVAIVVFLWPMMFFNIYTKPHSRVTASYWIQDNIPNGKFILSEHWDDPLPLLLPNAKNIYPGEQMSIFGEDTPSKFAAMAEQMSKGDYYILSSNRGWGSMPTYPKMYPVMGSFYKDLFAGKKGYQIEKVFTVYPSLEWLGIPITLPDDWADETFTVYDHPKVIIMKKTAS